MSTNHDPVYEEDRLYFLAMARSVLKLAPTGKGASVTLTTTATGQSVKLTPESRENIRKRIQVLRQPGPEADALVRQMRDELARRRVQR